MNRNKVSYKIEFLLFSSRLEVFLVSSYTVEVHVPFRVLKMTRYSLNPQFTFFFHESSSTSVFLAIDYEKNIKKIFSSWLVEIK